MPKFRGKTIEGTLSVK